MNKKMHMHPVAIVGYVGSLILIIGGLMSWITIPEGSLASLAGTLIEDAVNPKRTITWVIGVITLILGMLAAKKGSKGLNVVNLLLALFVAIPLVTAYVPADDPNAAFLGIDGMDAGFMLAVFGWIVLMVSVLAGFGVYKKSAPEKKAE